MYGRIVKIKNEIKTYNYIIDETLSQIHIFDRKIRFTYR